MACCSKAQIKAKKIATKNATSAAKALSAAGKIAKPAKVTPKKIQGKKVRATKTKPCRACGRR